MLVIVSICTTHTFPAGPSPNPAEAPVEQQQPSSLPEELSREGMAEEEVAPMQPSKTPPQWRLSSGSSEGELHGIEPEVRVIKLLLIKYPSFNSKLPL